MAMKISRSINTAVVVSAEHISNIADFLKDFTTVDYTVHFSNGVAKPVKTAGEIIDLPNYDNMTITDLQIEGKNGYKESAKVDICWGGLSTAELFVSLDDDMKAQALADNLEHCLRQMRAPYYRYSGDMVFMYGMFPLLAVLGGAIALLYLVHPVLLPIGILLYIVLLPFLLKWGAKVHSTLFPTIAFKIGHQVDRLEQLKTQRGILVALIVGIIGSLIAAYLYAVLRG